MRAIGWGLLASCALLLTFGAEAGEPAKGPVQKPANLLLITLDTTRADHLGCYGAKGVHTPVLDGLASEGALFEEAHSHVPLTLPSHANILTGDLPSTLNLRVNGLKFGTGAATLATRLKSKGYWTGAVVSSVILERSRGLDRGFDLYDDHMTQAPRSGGSPEERRAGETTKAALAALPKGAEPFFLWVHYYDPHFEYRPSEPYATEFAGRPYDGEIAYMDASLGELLAGLRKAGHLDNTLIVVVGDHGEGLGEHGEKQHGVFLYEYALHVPVIMVWKGHIRAGVRVPDLFGLDAIAPTALDLMGLSLDGMDGRSLRPALEGQALPPRPVYIESYHGFFTYGWAPLRGIMDGRWKYIKAPRPELYEWRTSEETNQFKPGSAMVAEAERTLARFPEADAGEQAQMEAFLKDPSNAEVLKQLTSLGYLAGGGARPDAQGLLDPKDAISIEDELQQVTGLMDMGDKKKAMDLLLSVLRRNPQNVPALSMLGLAYLNGGQLEKARLCFEEEVRLKPQMDTAHLNLGTTYKRLGKLDQAEKEYRAALALSPRMPQALSNLAQILLAQGRKREAGEILEPALSSGIEDADIYFESGVLAAMNSQWDRAKFAFSKVISMDPRRDEAFANLGKVAFQQGKVDEAISYYQRAIRVAPRNSSYLATLGSLYLNGKNDPSQALYYFQRALAADPYGPEARNLRDLIQTLHGSQE